MTAQGRVITASVSSLQNLRGDGDRARTHCSDRCKNVLRRYAKRQDELIVRDVADRIVQLSEPEECHHTGYVLCNGYSGTPPSIVGGIAIEPIGAVYSR